MSTHPLAEIPDPFLVAPLEVVTSPNAKDECLAVALKACVLLVAYDDRVQIPDYIQDWTYADAVREARKAVELGSKLEQ